MDRDLEKALSLAEDVILVLGISHTGGEGRGQKQDSAGGRVVRLCLVSHAGLGKPSSSLRSVTVLPQSRTKGYHVPQS